MIVGTDQADLRERARRVADKQGSDAGQLVSTPPPGWIVGTLDDAAEQLAALGEAGVTRVMCQHLAHEDLDAIAVIGGELAPRLRS